MIGLVLLTLGLTALARLALWTLPFRTIRAVIDSIPPLPAFRGKIDPRQIAWLVTVASRYVFRATCLTQALTARVLLNAAAIPNQLHIGVARDKTFESHAWIECEGRILVGGAQQSARFAKILTLASSPKE